MLFSVNAKLTPIVFRDYDKYGLQESGGDFGCI
jgi:hypothetical protein